MSISRLGCEALLQEPVVIVFQMWLYLLAGRVVSGRIDAVFDNNGRPEVIDWKTGRRSGLHPLQLAIYRLAWAEQHGLSVDEVDAAFLLVSSGEVDRPHSLPDREGLERILRGGSQ